MINCSKIAAGAYQLASCRSTNPAVLALAYAFNFDDWQAATKTYNTAGDIIQSIVAAGSDVIGAKFESHEKAFDASYSLTRGTYAAAFSHQVILRSFERTDANKAMLNKMAHGRYVLVMRNVDIKNPSTAFEVYGAENGLVASNIEFDSTNGDGVISAVTLASADGELESAVPTSVFSATGSTDADKLNNTKSMLDDLCIDD